MATSEVPEECYIAKPGATSTVLNFFGSRRDTNGKVVDSGTAICKSCNKAVAARRGNTSNLRSHLKNNHKLLYSQPAGSGSQAANPKS